MFEERNKVRVLTGRSLRVGGVLADHAIVGRSVWVNLNTLLPVQTAMNSVGREGE
jgi:hypothetical protein